MNSSSLLDRLERRFDRFAIRGLLRVIAGFQLLCFVLVYAKPSFIEFLVMSPSAWQDWEVWRFFTFCFIPRNLSLIWIFFVINILLLIGDQLEAEWGRFRLNLYYFSSVACLWIGVAVAGDHLGLTLGLMASTLLYANLFLAFATLVPDFTLLLLFVLPVKVKWLSLLIVGFLAQEIFRQPPLILPVLIAFIPYAVFAIPIAIRNLRHGARVSSRRSVYQSKSLPAGDSFHSCKICGRTELTDPTLEFRISDDEEEYCADHLP